MTRMLPDQMVDVNRPKDAHGFDADRLRKYLARFKIDWQALQA